MRWITRNLTGTYQGQTPGFTICDEIYPDDCYSRGYGHAVRCVAE